MWKEKQDILCARLQDLVYLLLEFRDDEDRYLPAGAHYMLVGLAPCRKKSVTRISRAAPHPFPTTISPIRDSFRLAWGQADLDDF